MILLLELRQLFTTRLVPLAFCDRDNVEDTTPQPPFCGKQPSNLAPRTMGTGASAAKRSLRAALKSQRHVFCYSGFRSAGRRDWSVSEGTNSHVSRFRLAAVTGPPS